jgi:[acyl-carrier-protein] S-malonyltransferase
VVVAGHAAAVDRAVEACQAAGARKAVRLAVSAPFHCALMAPAQTRLAADLARVPLRDAAIPVVNNADARAVRTADECRDGLVRQVSAPVRWQESVERLAREGATTFVEVGQGTVLSGLIRRIVKGAKILHVEDPASLEKTLAVLSPAARTA